MQYATKKIWAHCFYFGLIQFIIGIEATREETKKMDLPKRKGIIKIIVKF